MFIGHHALGLAAKRIAPRTSLGTLFLAPRLADLLCEGAMFVAGAWVYLTTTRARDAVGRYALWALLAFLLLSDVASLFTGPPPTLQAIELGGIVFG